MQRQLPILFAICLGAFLVWLFLIQPGGERSSPVLLDPSARADHILIEKSARRLTATQDGKVVFTADFALGSNPEGDKVKEGDGRTPEGKFTINRRIAKSAFHLSLGLNYPRRQDATRAAEAGVDPGGDIFIHGQPNVVEPGLNVSGDWTEGSIALTNAEVEAIWSIAAIGTRVEIRP